MLLTCRSIVRSLTTKLGGDRLVRSAGGHQAQHLQLARRQPVSVGSDLGPGERVDAGEVRRRSELGEDAAGGLQLQRGRVVVSQSAARESDEHARACGFVRRLELLPRPGCGPQRDQGSLGVAFGQLERASCVRHHRPQHLALVADRSFLELVACDASLLEIADGQHDLDIGGQQPQSLWSLDGFAERSADRGGRGGAVSLSQPQESQPRLRLPTSVARIPVRLLGRGEVALQAMHLALPVNRLRGRQLVHRLRATVVRHDAPLRARRATHPAIAGSRRDARGTCP